MIDPATHTRRRFVALLAAAGFAGPAVAAGPAVPQVELPRLRELRDDQPESLHRWHLYEFPFETATVGQRISFVGRYDQKNDEVAPVCPPWITVGRTEKPPPGKDRVDTLQTFAFQAARLEGLDEDRLAHVSGTIALPDPPAKDNPADRPPFRLTEVRGEAIRLSKTLAAMEQSVPAIVEASAARVKALCGKSGLTYAFDPETLSWSWYHGSVAWTAICTPHPRYSRKPVPYATLSVLFDPAKGTATELILMHRIWQDPPD